MKNHTDVLIVSLNELCSFEEFCAGASRIPLMAEVNSAGIYFMPLSRKRSGMENNMDDKLILKNRLKEARAELKISQNQLAEMVGVSRNTISSIETGQFNPTAKLALILCIALDKKFEDLFFF